MRHLYLILLALVFSFLFPKAYGQSVGAIQGNPGMCSPSYITYLSDTTAGGVWTISTSVATIGADGTVVGVAPGTATVTYTVGAYYATLEVTVNPTTPVITGILAVCAGLSTALSDATGGGTWSSSNTAVATVGVTTGVVTGGITPGIDTIIYTLGSGCTTTAVVTVNPDPGPIEGSMTVCVGLTTALTNAIGGGTWTEGCLASVATITGSTGVVEGVSAGTCVITYTLPTGCTTTAVVTVVATAPAPMGPTSVCVGNAFTLSDAITPGTWSSSNTAIVIVGSSTSILYANAPGTATITYTVFTGCVATVVITVNATPSAITGFTNICDGVCTTLNCTPAGGTWSCSTGIIAIGSISGIACGVASGTSTVSYIVATGCVATTVVTVNPPVYAISGSASGCVGSIFSLTDITTGGTWTSSNTVVASVVASTGIITGESAGTATITYALGTGCFSTIIVTVNPTAGYISGSNSLCVGISATFSDTMAGGTWSSSNISVGSVNSLTSVVTGIAPGTTTISYTMGSGCAATLEVTVGVLSTILGPTTLCDGDSTTLSDATSGGIWSSSNTTIATISSSGTVTGINSGLAAISYAFGTTCIVFAEVTINPTPNSVSGPDNICIGAGAGFSDATSGGVWSSNNTDVTIGSTTGIIVGAAAGTTYISYSLGSGCASEMLVTVNVAPWAIGGPASVCAGSTITLTDATSGGTWTCASTAIAIVGGGTGVVTGILEGVATISYSIGSGCSSEVVVTVNPIPSPISGSSTVCVGGTDTLSGFTGGTWSGGSGAATISTGGVISGISAGSATFTYTATTGCSLTFAVTVVAAVATVTGPDNVCEGSLITLSDATTGGVWTSSDPLVATVGSATGAVLGESVSGPATITYQLSSGCLSTFAITVNVSPLTISGPGNVCVGSTITLSDDLAGGTWSSSTPGVGTIIAASGILTGVTGGTTDITYELITGCFSLTTITVNALPTITAALAENCGGTYNLTGSGAGTGGTYSWAPATGLSCSTCSAPVATVSVSATYTLTGTDINSCANTYTVTVNGNRISGYMTMTTTPTDTVKVWLIQFNSTDSSLTAEDSALSCMDGGIPYYEFDNEPAGSYMVKAMLLGSIPGTSGYIPTYGLSTVHWDIAAPITHASATDTQHINMIYGTVPTGPGFIGGLISSGAGRGTSAPVPVPGMLVYLEDGSGNILTYTYTNTSGIYTFSDLALGTYRVYPEDYQYHTTPYISITLTASSDSVTSADFYQNTTQHTIIPGNNLSTPQIVSSTKISVYPNPAVNELNINWQDEQTGNADVMITDITGREVLKSVLNISTPNGSAQLDIRGLNQGIYFISIKSNSLFYTNKLLIGQ